MKKKALGQYKSIFLTILGFTLLVSFQNCSRISFEALNGVTTSPRAQNNGEGYSGKPEGDFYRFTPDFTCEQKVAPLAHLQIQGASVTLTENKSLLCGAVVQQLNESLIDTSIFQQEIIGYEEGIFEGKSKAPAAIPANLVEVWCKDRKDEQGVETLTHFDHTTNLAVNRIYYSKNGSQKQIQDFPVARVLANKLIIIKDENGFELTVHRDQPASQVGLFNAHLEAILEGQKIVRETFCRLGGSLDPKVWPAKQIVDFNVNSFKTSPDLNSLGYTSSTATGVLNLYATNFDGKNHVQASPNLPLNGVSRFLFNPDSKSLIYAGDARLSGFRELFKVNTDSSSHLQLSKPLDNVNQSVDVIEPFRLSNNGLSIIYGDASFSPSASAFSHTWLQSVPLSGSSTPQALTPPPSLALMGAKKFTVSKNKVIFSCCDTISDLYSVNTDGTGLLKITPPHPSDWSFQWATPMTGHGDYIYTLGIQNIPGQLRGYIVAHDGSDFVELPPGQLVDETVISDSHALLYQYPCSENGCKRQLLNIKTKTLLDLPNLKAGSQYVDSNYSPRIFFTKDSSALIGTRVLSDGSLQAVSISPAAGDLKELCPGLTSQQMVLKEIGQNDFLILTYDQRSQILEAYLSPQGVACSKVNSAVATNPQLDFLQEVSVSADNQKILIKLSSYGANPYPYNPALLPKANQLLYVPINGKPALVVDSPTHNAATVSQALFLKDSRMVLFVGDQVRPAEKNVFLWMAPLDSH